MYSHNKKYQQLCLCSQSLIGSFAAVDLVQTWTDSKAESILRVLKKNMLIVRPFLQECMIWRRIKGREAQVTSFLIKLYVEVTLTRIGSSFQKT